MKIKSQSKRGGGIFSWAKREATARGLSGQRFKDFVWGAVLEFHRKRGEGLTYGRGRRSYMGRLRKRLNK